MAEKENGDNNLKKKFTQSLIILLITGTFICIGSLFIYGYSLDAKINQVDKDKIDSTELCRLMKEQSENIEKIFDLKLQPIKDKLQQLKEQIEKK